MGVTKKVYAYAFADGKIYGCEGDVSDIGTSTSSKKIFWPSADMSTIDPRIREIFGGRYVHWLGFPSCFSLYFSTDMCWIFWLDERDDETAKEEFMRIYEKKKSEAEKEVKKCEKILKTIKESNTYTAKGENEDG